MRYTHWTHGFVILTLTGCLFGSALAEKPDIVERDPFINQLDDRPPTPRPDTNWNQKDTSHNNEVTEDSKVTTEDIQEAVTLDGISVTGIVASRASRQAIITDGEHTKIVEVGQVLSDFKVGEINEGFVILRRAGHEFKLPLITDI